MGYCTTFRLNWAYLGSRFCSEPLETQVSEAIAAAQEDGETLYGINPDGDTNEPCKWYKHESEMRKFSEKFPEVLFTLEGEGEESGDIWRKYFVNGKMQVAKAKISFDPFVVDKLR